MTVQGRQRFLGSSHRQGCLAGPDMWSSKSCPRVPCMPVSALYEVLQLIQAPSAASREPVKISCGAMTWACVKMSPRPPNNQSQPLV